MDIYVGNIPWKVDDDELKELFSQYGEVESATVIKYKDTNRSKGFGFVEMDDESAQKAIEALEGFEMDRRPLKVNQSRGKMVYSPFFAVSYTHQTLPNKS